MAGALKLLSGAVMMLAGYVGRSGSWTAAGFIAVLGGLVILAAHAFDRRAVRADGRTIAPHSSRRPAGVAVTAATLLSGAVMVLAGYAASAWGWGPAGVLATVGGLVIGAASAIDRRGVQAIRR